MNNDDKRKVKIGIAIAAFAVALFFILLKLSEVMGGVKFVFGVLSPFLYGICFAFVMNLVMSFLEEKVYTKINKKGNKTLTKLKRPLCLLTTVLIFLGVISSLIAFILPQLVKSSSELVNSASSYFLQFSEFANTWLVKLGFTQDFVQTVIDMFTRFSDTILNYVTGSIPKIAQAAMNVTSSIVNFFMGFAISIYMLATKEILLKNMQHLLHAYLPKKVATQTTHVYHLVNQRFSGFVSGQLTEAFIVGILCFFGMTIMDMDYALLISVIVGLTNIIPIIGPIIGAVPGVLILLMVEPIKALWFVIFIIVLQQLESNLIYPKVVGDSIGLPGIWVIFAIVIGGGLFGFAGIILGVPVFAVIYALLSEDVKRRLSKRQELKASPSKPL